MAALRVFPRLGLLDFPERYGLKRARLPYPTGILCVLTFLAFLLYTAGADKQTLGLFAGIAMLAVTCFIDDRHKLSPSVRLATHVAAAVLIFGTGTRIFTLTNPLVSDGMFKLDAWVIPFSPFDNPPVLSGLFTVAWLVLTINALNWFDGLPGQATSISSIGFLVLGFLAISPRISHMDPQAQLQLATLAFTAAGIAGGALLFDRPLPKVIPGDSGAMFFGLMLGVLTIYAGGKVATAFLVLGIPLIDSVIVVARRLAAGKSPFQGSASGEHLHHRLLHCGWSPWQILLLFASIGSAFGIAALFFSTVQKFLAALILALFMLLLHWYTHKQCPKTSSPS